LTGRQWELLDLLCAGQTNGQIARRLGIFEGTVRRHLENIYGRLNATSRAAAVSRAFADRGTCQFALQPPSSVTDEPDAIPASQTAAPATRARRPSSRRGESVTTFLLLPAT
jgi:DNA-binding CsgD family transcriptional regulator